MPEESRSNQNVVVLSVNPNSGSSFRSDLIKTTEEKLVANGFEPVVLSDITEVASQSRLLSESGRLRAVVAVGGDGTVSLLANTLEANTPLAILPMGTENLLAKHLGLTADPDSLVELLKNGHTKQLDAGRANGKLFLVMASCGFDANVVERLHNSRKGHISHLSYFRPILSSIRRYRYPRLSIIVDDGQESLSGSWLFLFNVSRYALNLPILSDADPSDGQLNMCSFRGGGNLRGIFYLASVLLGKHRQWCTTEFRKFRKMTVQCQSPNQSVPYQLDGDPGGHLPLEIEVVPGYLTVLVPHAT